MSIMARRFPPEFKRDVVTVARRSDATFEELASDFGISVNSLRRWMKQADIADGLAAGPSDGGPDDVVALRRRLRLLEQENEVLRRAAAYLSRDVLPK
jgi:transposase